jgi:hypothetical protein
MARSTAVRNRQRKAPTIHNVDIDPKPAKRAAVLNPVRLPQGQGPIGRGRGFPATDSLPPKSVKPLTLSGFVGNGAPNKVGLRKIFVQCSNDRPSNAFQPVGATPGD